jgi:predicted  nucleic acid-binding Zn-ribbon protein
VSVTALLGLVGTLFGVLSLIAGAAVYLRASYAKARIDALNAEIDEEKRRSSQLRIDLGEAVARIKVLEAKAAALNELVAQRANLTALENSVENVRGLIMAMSQVIDRVYAKVAP